MADMSASTFSNNSTGFKSILFCATVLLEFIVLSTIILLEYFLRWTEVFPIRKASFSCYDPDLSCTSKDAELLSEFAFSAVVPPEAVYALSFSIPPFIILIGEIGFYTFTDEAQRTINIIKDQCSIPQLLRRLFRFIGVFIFGGFTLMVFVDIIKIMVGRLRPDFLEVCHISNRSVCSSIFPGGEPHGTHDLCENPNRLELRQARTSFPSMNGALTAYAALFIGMYLHGAMRSHTVRIIRPFISFVFIMLALLSGLSEIGLCLSFWTDTVVGYCMGSSLAVYLAYVVLNNFQEHLQRDELLEILNSYIANSYHNTEKRYDWLRPEYVTSIPTSRNYVHERSPSDCSDAKYRRPRLRHNTFRRDTSYSIERYRRNSHIHGTSSHM
ncbi:hypothetical protein LOTGIDRAFT_157415 [Lottia gigantea]|uniref:Phosphatidic acid phosphatase type 2/haloperoxidase domain-containing protein n=1 Tax=Lottia gigantea TaxID=225164 RepID=V4B5G6_LOTGI|nr:hypothetical protein LOTGIDRAFT_157415 [Lottia gigantea]ESP01242.1 hypothetical protein LOTGIDRAFT_157415 [Lottia gigantea]